MGNLDSMTDLAFHYEKGTLGLQKDEDKAQKLYETARHKDFPRAINNLGILLLDKQP